MPEVAGDRGPLLDDFLLTLIGRPRPRACFVGTASGDDASYVEKFHSAFRGRADTTALALFNSEPEKAIPVDQLDRVLEHDVVYVGGGSTANLLAVWRLHGLVTPTPGGLRLVFLMDHTGRRLDDDRDAYLNGVFIGGREPVAITLVDYDERWQGDRGLRPGLPAPVRVAARSGC